LEVDKITNKIEDENTKNTKRHSVKGPFQVEKPKPKERSNPFQLKPYNENEKAMSPSKLSWIWKLKT
jgi:hypothetical protein